MEVLKSGDYQLIPIESSIIAFLCSVDWFAYGILDDINMKMMIPNGLGIKFENYLFRNYFFFDSTYMLGLFLQKIFRN